MRPLAADVWLYPYPFRAFGVDLRRNVTVLRLGSGDLVIHSSAPFTAEDVASIHALGRPRWLVDSMLDHDTFASQGRAAFPGATYLAPAGFSKRVGFPVGELLPAPPEWNCELEALAIDGAPGFSEVAMFHVASRTLIVADLVMNFPPPNSLWMELLLRVAIGKEHEPGFSRRLLMAIKDRAAFGASIKRLLEWDFERVVVGHGEVLEMDAKAKTAAMFSERMPRA
jgi:hypothetical protein